MRGNSEMSSFRRGARPNRPVLVPTSIVSRGYGDLLRAKVQWLLASLVRHFYMIIELVAVAVFRMIQVSMFSLCPPYPENFWVVLIED